MLLMMVALERAVRNRLRWAQWPERREPHGLNPRSDVVFEMVLALSGRRSLLLSARFLALGERMTLLIGLVDEAHPQ